MTEQARPFKNVNVNKIDTLETPTSVPKLKPNSPTRARDEAAEDEAFERNGGGPERSVLDKLVVSGWFSWENAIWLGLIALAVVMHLVNLGPRAMHHDESIHAKFSYDMFRGVSVYRYDPTFHGPVLYYMVSLSYFLFGAATETTARLAPAFFGIVLVGICYFLRPIIGRIGAVAAGLMVLFSPSILYYGRSLRHDIFATMGEMLFIIAFFRFIQEKPGRKSWWLPVAGLGLFIIYGSHEMVFLNVAILVAWLGLALAFEVVALPAWVKNRTAAERENKTGTPQPEAEPIEKEQWESREEELAAQGLDENPARGHERVGDPILGNWGYVGLALFGLLSLLAIWGSFYLFKTPAGAESSPQSFGLPQWLITIPFGILMALLVAYALGGFIAYSYSRLEAKNVLVGRLATLALFIVLGTLGIFSGLRAKAPEATADKPLPVVNGETLSGSDILFLGIYQLPRVVFNLVAVVLVALVVGLLVAWLWQRRFLMFTEKGWYGAAVSFFVVMLSTALVSLRFVLVDKGQPTPKGGLFLAGPEVDKWQAYLFNGFFIALAVGILAGWLVSLADRIDDSELTGSAILRGALRVARQPVAVGAFLLAFGVPYILLFGNFFFNMQGLADGIFRGVEYWAAQHGTRRLDEPWFYYPLIMLLYEIVPVVFGFAALFTFPVIFVRRAIVRGRCRFTVRGLFIGYTLWWSVLAMIAYSIAGEKAPWLNIQIALPTILAASAFLDFYLRRISWREFWGWSKGPLFAGLFVLTCAAVGVVIGMLINAPADSNQRTLRFVEIAIVSLIGLSLFAACFWLWWSRRISGRVAQAAVVLVVGLMLVGYEVKSTIALNYDHPDTANEMLVYVQTTPELPLFMQRLDRLSRDLRDTYKTTPPAAGTTQPDPSNSRGLPILLTNEVAWPLEWYLREYTNKNYVTPNNSADNTQALPSIVDGRGNNYVVIAVSSGENTTKLQQQLQGQYTAHQYKFRWWFPGESTDWEGLGKDIAKTNWGMMTRAFVEQPMTGRIWRYVMYRELWRPLDSFDMVVYVRNDINPDWALYEGGSQNPVGNDTGQGQPQPANGQAFNLFDSNQAGSRNGQYRTPRDVAVAPNGDILVLDSENARIQRFDKDGKFLSKFGSSGRDDGKFALAQYSSGPSGMAVDEDGNIYVADSWNFRIQKFDKDGKFLLKWGDGKDTGGDPAINQQFPSYFYGPRELAYDQNRKELYVADTGNRRILVFDRQGQYVRQFGQKGSGPGEFNEPVGVALNADGSKVYVTDLRNKRVQVLDPTGKYITEFKVGWNDQQALAEPFVKVDKDGNIFVGDPGNGRVIKFDQSGTQVNVYDSSKGFFLTNPVGMAFDSDGNLLVADAKRNAIVKITP